MCHCSWLELSRDEQARLLKHIRESQKKLSENVRMSQALVHFQSDEAWAKQRASAEAVFLTSQQDAEHTQLKQRLTKLAEGKKRRLAYKMDAKRQRAEEKRAERQADYLLFSQAKNDAFRKMLRFMRSQQEGKMDHVMEQHKQESRELLEAQEVEAR